MKEIFSDDKEKNKMIEKAMIELEDCPCCRGAGMIVHEGGWNVEVECTVCGAHTVYLEYESEPEKEQAERGVARLWNMGKVIKQDPGE